MEFTTPRQANQNLPLDPDEALRRCMGDVRFLALVLDSFVTELPACFSRLEAAIHSGDAPTAARHAHSIKGSVGVITGDILHPIASVLEQLCRNGNLRDAIEHLNELRDELNRCVHHAKQIQFDLASTQI